jgi:hypothetical protein
MIALSQPALALHSCDVPGYLYQMKTTWKMPVGASPSNFPAVVENEPGGYRPARLSASRFQALSSACHASPVSGRGGSGAEVSVSASRSRAGWTRSLTEMFRAAAFCGEPPKGVFRNGEVRHGVLHRR